MRFLLLVWLFTQVPAEKPRQIIVTEINRGPVFRYGSIDAHDEKGNWIKPTYVTGYWVVAKTYPATSLVIQYKLACDWAPVEVNKTYFIKPSNNADHPELQIVVFTDKDGKPSDMVCIVEQSKRVSP